jgi:hypothetical protein
MNYDDWLELYHEDCPRQAEYYLEVELQDNTSSGD